MTTKQVLTELRWLLISMIIASLFGGLVMFLFVGNTALDIQMHDTYFIASSFETILPFVFFFLFSFYFIRIHRNKFVNTMANWITLLSGFLTVVSFAIIHKLFVELSLSGITIYPPLSQFKPNSFSPIEPHPTFNLITKVTLVLQFTVLIALCNMLYRWWKSRRKLN